MQDMLSTAPCPWLTMLVGARSYVSTASAQLGAEQEQHQSLES